MKKIKFFLILLIIPFVFNGPVYGQSIEDLPYVSIGFSKSFGVPGETIDLNIEVSYPGFNLKIFFPNNTLAYDNNFTGSSRSLPITIQKPYGFYKVVISIPETKGQAFFSSLDNKGFELAEIPYNIYHKGVNYVFRSDWKLKANNLLIDFHFIRDLIDRYDLDFTVLKNDMNVVIRLRKDDVFRCDIVFSFLYEGCKFSINGTQDRIREFTVNIPYAKRVLESLRMGNTVFDYSDIPKGSYLKHGSAITLTVPKIFNVDPLIFESGFETGDFTEWTAIVENDVGTIDVVSTDPHHGTYHAQAVSDGAIGYGYVYENLASSYSELYTIFQLKYITSLPGVGNTYAPHRYRTTPGNAFIGGVIVSNDGGTVKWGVQYYDGAVLTTTLNDTATSPSLGTYYKVEFFMSISDPDGYVTLWIDDDLTLNVTGLDNDLNGNPQRVIVGDYGSGGTAHTTRIDCVGVDDERITDDPFIPVDTTPPQWSSVSESSTLAGNSSTFNSYWYDIIGNLSHYIFQWNNTGSTVNDSAVSFPALNNTWVPISKTLNSTVGITICWRVYGNDTSNNWNVTAQRCFITTVSLEDDVLTANDMVFIFCLFQLILGIIAIIGVPWLGLIAIFLGFLLLIPVPVSTPGTFLFDMQIYSLVISSFMALLGIVLHWDKFL